MSDPSEQQRLIDLARQVLTENYRQQPIVLRRGAGCRVIDVAGTRYLDLTAGIAACPLGHGHQGLGLVIAESAVAVALGVGVGVLPPPPLASAIRWSCRPCP